MHACHARCDEYTDKSNWLGGHCKDGKPLRGADALAAAAAQLGFEQLSVEPVAPLLIADHARKFQLLLAHKVVLRRKA